MLAAYALIVSMLPVAQSVSASEASASLVAPLVHESIRIDGRFDEPAWARAPVSRPFTTNRDGKPARLVTTARLLHASEGIYVGLQCAEPDPGNPVIKERDPRDVNIWSDDCVEIFFDPGRTRSRYYQAVVNARGVAVAGFNGQYAFLPEDRAAVHVADDAWSVEILIARDKFASPPQPGDLWGLNLYRTRRPRNADDFSEQLAWHPTRSGFRKPHLFGTVLFAGPFVWPAEEAQQQRKERVLREVTRALDRKGRWSPRDVSETQAAERARRLTALIPRISRLNEPLLVAPTEAITDEAVFPWTVPSFEQIDRRVVAYACPDEFEPASFNLFATRDLDRITIRPGEFVSEDGHEIPASAIDLRVVKCWYQSGWAHVTRDDRTLVPELLLRDPSLIEVDPATRENKLNFEGYPTDAKTLQPFDIRAFETRQVWMTFHPPADTVAGLYAGKLLVAGPQGPMTEVPVRLVIYPFKLAPSMLDYSLYYRLRPSKTPDPVATMKRMAAEIRNQVEHGINMPSTYIGGEPLREGGPPMEALEELTRIYRELGLRDHPLILVTTAVGRQSKPEQLERIRKMAERFVTWARRRGYSDVYFQGIDEGDLETLRQERQAFQAVHDGGGMVFVACGADYFDVVGDLLDMPVISGVLRPDVARKVRAQGHRVFSYYNPQAGVELPLTYRRNYGLSLMAAGYDGGFNYEYQQHDPDTAYDEFKSEHYRNHTMAYPTADGPPIDTRQWEGWREGCDDVRYASTYVKMREEWEEAGEHEVDVRHRPLQPTLDGVREGYFHPRAAREMISGWICAMQKQGPEQAVSRGVESDP